MKNSTLFRPCGNPTENDTQHFQNARLHYYCFVLYYTITSVCP